MAQAGGQHQLPLDPFVHRGLFARHFLLDRLPEWPEFAGDRFGPLWDQLSGLGPDPLRAVVDAEY